MPQAPRVVALTGAAGGIGRALAKALCAEGTAVLLIDAQSTPLDELAEELAAQGHEVCAVRADVREPEALAAAVEAGRRRWASVGGLVTCAGVMRRGFLINTSEESWDEVLGVNLTGTFLSCQAFLPWLAASGGGSIVTFSSALAFAGAPGAVPYGAAKAAVLGFTKSLALEAAGQGIRVNAIAPGIVDTGMPREGLGEEEFRARAAARGRTIPLGRIAQPADLIGAVLFLLSPASAYMTGQTLHLNGGGLMP